MSVTPVQVQSAIISYLKGQTSITSQLTGVSGTEVREYQWQGADFVYPALRVYVDLKPSINGCGPDTAMVCIEAHSEQKSSLQCQQLTGSLTLLLHKKRFKAGVLDFPMVRVTDTTRPERTIFGWMSKVNVTVLVNDIGAINAQN